MTNPLFGGVPQMSNQMTNLQQIMQQFNQFKQAFQGDPRQQVQQLLNSGRVSQQQYNNAYQMARQLEQMMNTKP